jgi:hypothetical protein
MLRNEAEDICDERGEYKPALPLESAPQPRGRNMSGCNELLTEATTRTPTAFERFSQLALRDLAGGDENRTQAEIRLR